jgi:hypothetical protein
LILHNVLAHWGIDPVGLFTLESSKFPSQETYKKSCLYFFQLEDRIRPLSNHRHFSLLYTQDKAEILHQKLAIDMSRLASRSNLFRPS